MELFESNRLRNESDSTGCERGGEGPAFSEGRDNSRAAPPAPLSVLRLEDVIAAAVHANRAFADRARVEFDVALERGGTRVRGDAAQLTQVLGRVLRGATRRSHAGGTVSIRVYPSGDRDVAVSIRDRGAEIPVNLLDSIFGTVRDGPAAATPRDTVRAGMPVARSLAALHGGTVTARSVGPGEGSEFVVTLATLAAPRLSVVAPPEPRIAPRRILVVDDVRDSADTLQALLRLDGHTVEVGYEGAVVAELADRFRPDVIVLDLDLPDVMGCEVARRLRRNPGGAVLVALTGFGGEPYRTAACEAGFEHYLLKPVDLAALRRVLAPRLAAAPHERAVA